MQVVVAGFNSQKVWVFTMEEEDQHSLTMVPDFLVKMSQITRPRTKAVHTIVLQIRFIQPPFLWNNNQFVLTKCQFCMTR